MSEADWEQRLSEAWASLDERSEAEFLSLIESLAAELPPDSSVGLFERASSLDSTGYSDLAVPLYRQALDLGLTGERRRRAVIQMASSLRNLNRPEESIALLTAELEAPSDGLDDAVRAFLALALTDAGREREAVSLALKALAPHLPRYGRSLTNYAGSLSEAEPGLTIHSITIDCRDPRRLAQFWASALHYMAGRMEDDLATVRHPSGGRARLLFLQVPEEKIVKNRVHLDLSAAGMDAEVARLVELGAQTVQRFDFGPGDTFTVMQDPEGNEFCVEQGL